MFSLLHILSIVLPLISLVASDDGEDQHPKLTPMKHELSLKEYSKLRLFCSIQSGAGPFVFEWRKNYRLLDSVNQESSRIETGDDWSSLMIARVSRQDAGNYSCVVKNHRGQDSQMVKLVVKVPPTWTVEPEDVHTSKTDTRHRRVECRADGSPKPTIKWVTAKGAVIESEFLDVHRYRTSNVDSYECIAENGVGEPLKKSIKVSFMVPVQFSEKFAILKVRKGESANLTCNATGDHPLKIRWSKNTHTGSGSGELDRSGSNYEIRDQEIPDGHLSEMVFSAVQSHDASIYRCAAENEHGKDERTIRLDVVEVPDAPKAVRVKEVWSKTAKVVWNEPSSSGAPIQRYTVQYWRHQNAPHRLHEVSVSGSTTSLFIKDLSPGQSYELSVIAENEVGKGQSSTGVTFTTGEEEPSAPPNDIIVEAMGAHTVKVSWRSPPLENWNGFIRGYYVGYRKSTDTASHYNNVVVDSSGVKGALVGVKKELGFHEHFIRQLERGAEYKVHVKAYNSAGAGPESHEILIQTYDGDLPPPLQLNVLDSAENSITLRWYPKLHPSNAGTQSVGGSILSYTVHYQKEGDTKWLEVPVIVPTAAADSAAQMGADLQAPPPTHSYLVESLEPNVQYRFYVSGANRFGVGDPSNVAVGRTVSSMAVLQHDILRGGFSPDNAPYYVQPAFFWPVLIAAVIIVLVCVVAYVCIRKSRNEAETAALALDPTGLNKRFSAIYGNATLTATPPRYMDFEQKNIPGEAGGLGGTSGHPSAFNAPYSTLPINENSTTQPWDRPLPNPSSGTMRMIKTGGGAPLTPKSSHIYDQPI